VWRLVELVQFYMRFLDFIAIGRRQVCSPIVFTLLLQGNTKFPVAGY
jgi:hypothetical protein